MVILALFAGCAGIELPDESLVERLQVVGVVADRPELAPGQSTELTVWVGDPDRGDVDLLVWSCTTLGEGCFEAEFPQSVWVRPVGVLDGYGVTTAEVPLALGEYLPLSFAVPTSVWALACEPGLCPIIDDARAGVADPALLGDPAALMAELPIEGTSLVRRGLLLSWSAQPNHNPSITAAPPGTGPIAAPGSTETLALVVSDSTDVVAHGYVTCGSLSNPTWDGHDLSFTWTAPGTPGTCDLWIALEDGFGGAAIWHGARDVR